MLFSSSAADTRVLQSRADSHSHGLKADMVSSIFDAMY
jgi:hypothetical protein